MKTYEMKKPVVHLILSIVLVILYVVFFIQEQTLFNGFGVIIFGGYGIKAFVDYKKLKE